MVRNESDRDSKLTRTELPRITHVFEPHADALRINILATSDAAFEPQQGRCQLNDAWIADRMKRIDASGIRKAVEDVSRFTDRAFAEMMQTGVTVLRDTVMPVGNVGDPWGEYQKSIEVSRAIMAANRIASC